jgi:hypothetical protein
MSIDEKSSNESNNHMEEALKFLTLKVSKFNAYE